MGHRIISISGELFTEMATEGWQAGGPTGIVRCIEGLPEGARFVASSAERRWAPVEPGLFVVHLLYYHPDWPDVPPGEPYPRQPVTFERVEIDERGNHN